jgi:serine/threonine protein kinase
MGIVHRAKHRLWGIEVAIKHPRHELLYDHNQVKSFDAECELWAAIGLHPYVATCYYATVMDDLPCVIAEYLPNGSLNDAIHSKNLYRGDEDASLSHMLCIAASTAWGLARAHEVSLLHCDVKPANILLTSHGVAKIADFGLSTSFGSASTRAKAAGITPAFASPEQSRGEDLTIPADIWSWAASMLAMFTGEVYWENGAACGGVLNNFLKNGAKAYRIPAMPNEFSSLLQKCFHQSPAQRPQNLSELAFTIGDIYERIFGEQCNASKPDLELISADSLNNRAVSKHDLGLTDDVYKLIDASLRIDALHPEANFNLACLDYIHTGVISNSALINLEAAARFEPSEFRPHIYRACLLSVKGESATANDALNLASERCSVSEEEEKERLWLLSQRGVLNLMLSPPISGEELALDTKRFWRLIAKAELAIKNRFNEDAKRYLLMTGDIPRFSRHPERQRLLSQL